MSEIDKDQIKRRITGQFEKMDRQKLASNPQGAAVYLTDVSDREGFRGDWWVEFEYRGSSYTVDSFQTRHTAEDVAYEVVDLMI